MTSKFMKFILKHTVRYYIGIMNHLIKSVLPNHYEKIFYWYTNKMHDNKEKAV